MLRNKKWNTTWISYGTDNVFSICKWHDRGSKQLNISVCRWWKITKKDKKPHGLQKAPELCKQDIWWKMEFNTK